MLSRVLAVLCLLLAAVPGRAEDLTGRFGAGGFFGAAVPTGGDYIQSHGSTGDAWGLFLRYGVDPNWGVELAYDRMSFNGVGLRLGDVTINSLYSFFPDRRWTPVLIGGIGFGEGEGSVSDNNLSLRAGVGVEYFLTPDLSAGAQALYNFVSDTGNADNSSLATTLGVTLTAYFGPSEHPEEAAAPPPAQPAPIPPPPPPAPMPAPLVPAQAPASEVAVSTPALPAARVAVSTPSAAAPGVVVSTPAAPLAPVVVSTPAVAASQVVVSSPAAALPTTVAVSSLAAPHPVASAKTAPETQIELHIQFDPYSDVVKPLYDADIARVADYLKRHPGVSAEVQGHTDDSGWLLRNMRLSQKRADAVRQVLIQKFGVDPSRVTAKGYGPTRPVADNATPEGRVKNRRVVVVFSGP